jgi:hypothetical protein
MQHYAVNNVDENVRRCLHVLKIEVCDSEDKMKEGIFMDPKL